MTFLPCTSALLLNQVLFLNLLASWGGTETMRRMAKSPRRAAFLMGESVSQGQPHGYDPLTWNIIPARSAQNCLMMRSGYWRPKVNYHWLDFIKLLWISAAPTCLIVDWAWAGGGGRGVGEKDIFGILAQPWYDYMGILLGGLARANAYDAAVF